MRNAIQILAIVVLVASLIATNWFQDQKIGKLRADLDALGNATAETLEDQYRINGGILSNIMALTDLVLAHRAALGAMDADWKWEKPEGWRPLPGYQDDGFHYTHQDTIPLEVLR